MRNSRDPGLPPDQGAGPNGGAGCGLPAGSFQELDLDADDRLVPVQREPGTNTAHLIVGLISNPTEVVPEGMQRVMLLSDPTQGLGNLAEPECRRVNAALAYAASVILNRRLASSESGLTLAIYSTVVYLVPTAAVGLCCGQGIAIKSQHPSLQFLTRAWIWPTPFDFGLIALTGLIAAIGFYALARAYSIAPAGTVAPFEYVMLLMGVIWGFVFWHEFPDYLTLIGMTLVVCSGLILLPRRKPTPEPLVYAANEG